jgi:hypothetical protein
LDSEHLDDAAKHDCLRSILHYADEQRPAPTAEELTASASSSSAAASALQAPSALLKLCMLKMGVEQNQAAQLLEYAAYQREPGSSELQAVLWLQQENWLRG